MHGTQRAEPVSSTMNTKTTNNNSNNTINKNARFAVRFSAALLLVSTFLVPLAHAQTIGGDNFRTTTTGSAVTTGVNSIAIGSGTAAGNNNIALGYQSYATGSFVTAIGYSSTASANNTLAIGTIATALGEQSAAIGIYATATGVGSLAIGTSATATGRQSTAIGAYATAAGQYGVAIGYHAGSTGFGANAFGDGATAAGAHSNAIGTGANATANYANALGFNATAGNSANALGFNASATAASANAFGTSATATGVQSNAIGTNAIASGVQSNAIGAAAQATNTYANAFGFRATATGIQTIAIGSSATASNSYSTAIGCYANASGDTATAIGRAAAASGTQSIAFGRSATATLDDSIALGSWSIADRDAGFGGSSLAALSIGTTGTTRQIINVARGTEQTDAVNVSQLTGVINTLIGSGSMDADGNIISGTFATGDTTINGAITTLYNNTANIYTTATTLAADALLWNSATNAFDASRAGAPAKITNLAQGAISAISTDAVTGSQLFDTNQRVTNLETQVANIYAGNANPYFTTGTTDLDTTPASATGNNVLASGRGATAAGDNATAIGGKSKATAAHSTAIGANSQAQAPNSTALGDGATVLSGATGAVAIGANSTATEPNTVSFGNDGSNGQPAFQRRLTNVAPGQLPTDAVNMSQLTAFQGDVTNNFTRIDAAINKLGTRLDSVGAMTAAMGQAQLRLSPQENRSEIAMGIGAYRGHGAFAMNYGYTSRRGDRGIQAGFAMSDRADVMGGAGVVFGW